MGITKSEKIEQFTRMVYELFGKQLPSDIIFVVNDPASAVENMISTPRLVVSTDGISNAHSVCADGFNIHFTSSSEIGI